MQRHPINKNLSIYNDETFEGLPLMVDKGPFIYDYLKKLKSTMERALGQYPRVFAFRCDLRFPAHILQDDQSYANTMIGNFIESFKAKIAHNRRMAVQQNKHAHTSEIRYVWVREQGQRSPVHHYHLLILLNQDAFYTLGKVTSDNPNLFHRLEEAWASALGLSVSAVRGLVEIPDNATYRIRRDELMGQAELFRRASYLCKAATKVYGQGQHGFGCSRI